MSWHRKLPNQAACSNCCGIKEKLQTLWDRTINSILRINQVEPDDQGNIRIRSDSEALTVSEGTNEIVLNLDTSELPAAVVDSVNGQTGDVILHSSNISADGGVSVQGALDNLSMRVTTNASNIGAEATARQNADTALQNNINALQASIPTEAAAAVAADPTVQTFAAAAADIPNKVDKRTGSGLRAYTHTGSTQDDTVVEDGTTGATIPIRDANGRMQAADPANGATDKTLTTANWISQTGNNAPNNLVHRTGNESKSGILQLLNAPLLVNGGTGGRLANTSQYLQFILIRNSADANYNIAVTILERGMLIIGMITVNVVNGAVDSITLEGKTVTGGTNRIFVGANMTSDGLKVYCHSNAVNRAFYVNVLGCFASSGYAQNVTPSDTIVTSTPTGYVETQFIEV